MTAGGERRPRILLYSALAHYPIHWEAFRRICREYDVDGMAFARSKADLPSVHEQLGWVTATDGEIAIRTIPSRSTVGRMRWLRRELGSYRPDAIWVQQEPTDLLLLEFLAVARTLPRTRIVGAVCENIFVRTPRRLRVAGKLLWPRLDAVAAVATASIDGVREIGFPASVSAEPLVAGALSPPATLEPMDLGLPAGTFVVGFAGRITAEKGWRVLIEAMKRLPDGFAVAFAGDGPDSDRLRSALASPGLAGRSVSVGLLPKNELWRFYAALDALVVPSLTTARWKEQFGGVLADAMAIGLPVVGSSSGAIPEVIGPAGLVSPEGDAAQLAACLLRLAGDSHLREELGRQGRERFEREFSITAYADKLASLLGLARRAERAGDQPPGTPNRIRGTDGCTTFD